MFARATSSVFRPNSRHPVGTDSRRQVPDRTWPRSRTACTSPIFPVCSDSGDVERTAGFRTSLQRLQVVGIHVDDCRSGIAHRVPRVRLKTELWWRARHAGEQLNRMASPRRRSTTRPAWVDHVIHRPGGTAINRGGARDAGVDGVRFWKNIARRWRPARSRAPSSAWSDITSPSGREAGRTARRHEGRRDMMKRTRLSSRTAWATRAMARARRAEDVGSGGRDRPRAAPPARVVHWTVALTFFIAFHRVADLDALPRIPRRPVRRVARCRVLHPWLESRSRLPRRSCRAWDFGKCYSRRRSRIHHADGMLSTSVPEEDADVGKYNGGQKMLFWAAGLGALGLLLSGIVMWLPQPVSSQWLRQASYIRARHRRQRLSRRACHDAAGGIGHAGAWSWPGRRTLCGTRSRGHAVLRLDLSRPFDAEPIASSTASMRSSIARHFRRPLAGRRISKPPM